MRPRLLPAGYPAPAKSLRRFHDWTFETGIGVLARAFINAQTLEGPLLTQTGHMTGLAIGADRQSRSKQEQDPDTCINQHKVFAGEICALSADRFALIVSPRGRIHDWKSSQGEPDVVVVGAGIMSARSHYHIDVSAIAAKQSAMLKKTGRCSI